MVAQIKLLSSDNTTLVVGTWFPIVSISSLLAILNSHFRDDEQIRR
jgi:hypothetical protein